jgi:tRNA pseudouridine38-40 synthase
VQGTIEQALEAITGEDVRITGSGRTDAGAHACAQVIAFSTRSTLPAETFRRALNAHLPDDIAVVSAEDAAADFHPRFDASSRIYRYLIWNRPERSPFYLGRAHHVPVHLNDARMNDALSRLVGIRDVSAFVPVRADGPRARRIFSARCCREGDLITITLEASGFMRQMVRAIVGTVISVGRGRMSVEEFEVIVRAGRRTLAGDTAPAHGLYLDEVVYRRESGDSTLEE